MNLEVNAALTFLASIMIMTIPQQHVERFVWELGFTLMSRYYGHWYPDNPLRGSAFRSLHFGTSMDPVLDMVARRSRVDIEEVRASLPKDLYLWIDPFEVSFRIGERGKRFVIRVLSSYMGWGAV